LTVLDLYDIIYTMHNGNRASEEIYKEFSAIVAPVTEWAAEVEDLHDPKKLNGRFTEIVGPVQGWAAEVEAVTNLDPPIHELTAVYDSGMTISGQSHEISQLPEIQPEDHTPKVIKVAKKIGNYILDSLEKGGTPLAW
jgi:hypothetical protein